MFLFFCFFHFGSMCMLGNVIDCGFFCLVNCWPTEAAKGCQVNIEYTLNGEGAELRDVVISIPIPYVLCPSKSFAFSKSFSATCWQMETPRELWWKNILSSSIFRQGYGAPVVSDCDGEYSVERGVLHWKIPVIDESNDTGILEFTTPGGQPGGFFPVKVDFTSSESLLGVRVGSFLYSESFLNLNFEIFKIFKIFPVYHIYFFILHVFRNYIKANVSVYLRREIIGGFASFRRKISIQD